MASDRPTPRTVRSDLEREQAGRAALLRLLRILLISSSLVMAAVFIVDIGESPQEALGEFEVQLITGWPWVILFGLTVAFGVIAIDALTPNKKISTLSGVFLGLVVGVIASIATGFLLDRLAAIYEVEGNRLVTVIKILSGIALTYLSISIVLQTQDQFRLVIPYVEFARQIRGARPLLLDTSAIIDGRVAQLGSTGLIQAPLVIPRFVIEELQTLADSRDKLKRARGRRGLDLVRELQRDPLLDVTVDETPAMGLGVDQKLVELARSLPGAVVTCDSGLERVAAIHNVSVINMNDVATAARANVIAGEPLEVTLLKPGEQPAQGVGYLDDGTMVVAEDGAEHVGERVTLTVTSTLQTSAGKMVFGRMRPIGQDAPERVRDDAEDDAPETTSRDSAPVSAPNEPGRAGASPARERGERSSARNPRR